MDFRRTPMALASESCGNQCEGTAAEEARNPPVLRRVAAAPYSDGANDQSFSKDSGICTFFRQDAKIALTDCNCARRERKRPSAQRAAAAPTAEAGAGRRRPGDSEPGP